MRLGVLGMGSAGKRHARNVLALGHSVVYHDSQLKSFDVGIETTHIQRQGLIEVSDAIIIATPSNRHHIDLADCVAAGKHVLVEKPIGVVGTAASVEKSLAVAKDKGLVVAVGFNLRFHPTVVKVHHSGIRPYFGSFICCQATDKPNAGVINDWLCHELDLAQHIMGPLRLIDHHAWEGQADLLLANWMTGARAFIHSDMIAQAHVRKTILVERDSSVAVDFEADPVTDNHYCAELAAFISKIEGNKPQPLATGEDGLSVLRICEQVASCALSQ